MPAGSTRGRRRVCREQSRHRHSLPPRGPQRRCALGIFLGRRTQAHAARSGNAAKLSTMQDLFGPVAPLNPSKLTMAEGALLLRGAALPFEREVLAALNEITAISPFRHMVTPGGFTM